MNADPGNKWFGRMNRQRLEAEPMRDAMYWRFPGPLDPTPGGPATRNLSTGRRTLYLMTIRSDRSNFRMLFDAADPTGIVDHRIDSTVAPQALFLMNDPFVLDKAAALASRALAQPLPDDRARIDWLYQLLFARHADPNELAIAQSALQEAGPGRRGSNTVNCSCVPTSSHMWINHRDHREYRGEYGDDAFEEIPLCALCG